MDIRRQLGLDYLRRSGEEKESVERSQEPLPPFLSDALIAYGRKILESLARVAPATGRLFSLIDELQMPIDVALRVVEHLEGKKYLTVVRRDLKGDHDLAITDEGRKLLG